MFFNGGFRKGVKKQNKSCGIEKITIGKLYAYLINYMGIFDVKKKHPPSGQINLRTETIKIES